MASAYDVAAFILAELGQRNVGKMQLQKLVYYSQAWSLAWDRQPLFFEPIEAWDKGPVVGELLERSEPSPQIARIGGDASKLSDGQRGTISAVLDFYGGRSGTWLSALSHREQPWRNARAGATGGQKPIITHDAMCAFFGSYGAPARCIPESIARGLDMIVDLPEHLVEDVLHGEAVEVEGLEHWLETGEGDPWQTSGA
jgi:uncharacterized phage-associated protein